MRFFAKTRLDSAIPAPAVTAAHKNAHICGSTIAVKGAEKSNSRQHTTSDKQYAAAVKKGRTRRRTFIKAPKRAAEKMHAAAATADDTTCASLSAANPDGQRQRNNEYYTYDGGKLFIAVHSHVLPQD